MTTGTTASGTFYFYNKKEQSIPIVFIHGVGLNGEIEHASAFIHTLRFGNKFRDAVGGTSYLSFTNTRSPAGSKI